MDELEVVAAEHFGLEVAERLPVTQSFSSTVLSFVATDGSRRVVKRHWSRQKAEREARALRALDHHPDVPALQSTAEHDGALYLLIEGFDGDPWEQVAETSPELLRRLGRSMRRFHSTPADSFDGAVTWHELLGANADRYTAMIDGPDADLAMQGHSVLVRHLDEVPVSDRPCLVHFDLRPGNVLVRRGRFVGIIDLESSRGGHASMDFFKLWQQVAPHVPAGLPEIVRGYRDAPETVDATVADRAPSPDDSWIDPSVLDRLMRIYAAYHGLAGLAWCHDRGDFRGDFPDVNRNLIRTAVTELH